MSSDNNNSQAIILVIITIGVLVGVGLLYDSNRSTINGVLVGFCKAHLYFYAHLPIGDSAADAVRVYNRLQQIPPGSLSFYQVMGLFGFVGQYLLWVCVPVIMALTAYGAWHKRAVQDRFRTRHNMDTLLKRNVDFFPCIAPAVNRQKTILAENPNKGVWKTARSPLQFAVENHLLVDPKTRKPLKPSLFLLKNGFCNERSPLQKGKLNIDETVEFDSEKAQQVFIRQLGGRFRGLSSLPEHKQALAGVFLAFGLGKKDEAQRILDQLSSSFREPTKPGGDFEIDIDGSEQLLKQYAKRREVLDHTKHHMSYANVFLMALLCFARRKGVLANSQFVWLRPADRTLWYALNQLGGRTAWAEAAGPWAHYQAEELIGRKIIEPCVDTAVSSLDYILQIEGWVPLTQKDAVKRFKSHSNEQ